MQIIQLFVLLIPLSVALKTLSKYSEVNVEILTVSKSIKIILDSSCENCFVSIIKSIGNNSEQSENDLIEATAMFLSVETSVQLVDVEHIKNFKWKRNFVIIFVDTFETFEAFHSKISAEKFDHSGFYIIVVKHEQFRHVEQMFKLMWQLMIYKVNAVVYEDYKKISLYTFMPFRDKLCNNVRPLKISDLNYDNLEWSNQTFFLKKFTDLNNCSIRIGTYESAPGLIVRSVGNTSKVLGFEGEMFNEIALELNFKMDISVVDYGGGNIDENGTASGLLEKVMLNEFDLIMSLFSANYLRTLFLTPTKSYYVDKMIVIIPTDRLLDPFLKLFHVFHIILWMTLLTIFLSTLVIFQIVKSTFPQFHQKFLSEIRIPYLSLLVAFVGGSEKSLPRKDFPRILLAMFLLFFMVIRTIYQGGLFNILKKDVRINEINSISDINKFHYTFYIINSIDVKTKDLSIFKR